MDIRIQSMSLRNFKGIKDYFLDIKGQNTTISAANGLGKTTLYDAFLWVLFGKDSTNRMDFSVKTTDANGQEIHGLEHDVQLNLAVDGSIISLRKQFTEKWIKRRGEANKEFTGHETSFWIDDVPVKKNEYVKRIEEFVPESIFKLLTNPYYFNQQFSWQDRRKLLMEICGDVTDLDVIASDNKLEKLNEILTGKSTEDYRKILAERIKKLNQEIEKIPVRIDELNSTLLDGGNIEYEIVEAGLADFKAKLNTIERELAGANDTAGQLREKQQQLFKLERDIEERKREFEKQANAGNAELLSEKQKLEMKLLELDNERTICEASLDFKGIEINTLKAEMEALREKWAEVNTTSFASPDERNFICPTCKRELPKEDIERQISEMEVSFTADKAQKLSKINTEGKDKKDRKEKLEAELTELEEKVLKNNVVSRELNDRIVEIEKELSPKVETEINYSDDAEIQRLKQERKIIQIELDKPAKNASTELLQQKQEIVAHIEDLNRVLNQREVTEKTKARIQELKAEERKLAQQISEAEGQRYLIERFIKAKVNLLEDSINNRFKSVKFKLFDVQINGGIVECCETLINGVPFADANHAGQINAGIDIINTLSDRYKLSCPLWVDNAEAINQLAETAGQVIRLVVSNDKEMKVEVDG